MDGDTQMMLRQILHFQAVVEENSFTEAADRCYISQSGISQSIKSLEKEIGVPLLIRHNRSFELTEAGKHFYRKSLVITSDLEQLVRETARIGKKDADGLSLGCLSTYGGDEFNQAVAMFAEKNPTVDLKVTSGNHEDLFQGLQDGDIDLALNDQRRAFSDTFENLVLKETVCFVELATYNPLTKLDRVDVSDLKNMPCILISSPEQQEEERRFYHDVIGFKGEFLFARTLQDARIMVVANRGVMPVETVDGDSYFGASLKHLPLTRDGELIKRTYCAFWKKNHDSQLVEEFAQILKRCFDNHIN